MTTNDNAFGNQYLAKIQSSNDFTIVKAFLESGIVDNSNTDLEILNGEVRFMEEVINELFGAYRKGFIKGVESVL